GDPFSRFSRHAAGDQAGPGIAAVAARRGARVRSALAFFIAVAVVGCGPQPKPAVSAAELAPTLEPGWHTLRAEHRVTVEVSLPNGKHEKRSLRGVIAI